jgi:hypothetical protein
MCMDIRRKHYNTILYPTKTLLTFHPKPYGRKPLSSGDKSGPSVTSTGRYYYVQASGRLIAFTIVTGLPPVETTS